MCQFGVVPCGYVRVLEAPSPPPWDLLLVTQGVLEVGTFVPREGDNYRANTSAIRWIRGGSKRFLLSFGVFTHGHARLGPSSEALQQVFS